MDTQLYRLRIAIFNLKGCLREKYNTRFGFSRCNGMFKQWSNNVEANGSKF